MCNSRVNAASINGIFDPSDETLEGVPVFRKRGDPDTWLSYYRPLKDWRIQSTKHRGAGPSLAYVVCDPVCVPHLAPVGSWHISNGTTLVAQSSVTISIATQSLGEYQAIVEDTRRRFLVEAQGE